MREEVLQAIKKLGLPGLGVSNEFPYSEGGIELYLKNPKQIYVDREQVSQAPLFQTLNGGCNVNNSTTVVTVFFAVDAKNKPASYDASIEKLKAIKDVVSFPGSTSRIVSVSTDYAGDLLVSELEYEFTKII